MDILPFVCLGDTKSRYAIDAQSTYERKHPRSPPRYYRHRLAKKLFTALFPLT